MRSSITPQLICGILLLLVTIASSRKSRDVSKNEECTQIPKVVTIEQITEPVEHAEGPTWDHRSRKLYFVDIHEQKIYRLDTATGELTHVYIALGEVGVAVPVEGEPDKFVAGAGTDFVLITWDPADNSSDPDCEVLGTVDTDRNGTRFNDGKVDSHGRFWAGTIGHEDSDGVTPDQASLYRLTSDGVKKEISPVTNSNGLAWNKEDTLFYYIDSATLQIAAYDFDAHHGKISNKRIVFDLASNGISGIPDGMTIDTDGNLWVALYDGGRVIKVDPVQGRMLEAIEMPADKVTSVTWGGNLFDILYGSTCSKCHRHSKPKVVQIIPAVRQTQGPHWDHETKKLYYVQTMDQKICRYDPVTGKTTYADIATGSVGTAVPVKNEHNKFLVSAGQKFVVVTWDPRTNNTDPEIKMLASAENVNGTHLNDGKADTHGRFWAGTMGPTDANNAPMILADQGAFYRVTGDGVVKPVIKPVTISNGISWNKEDKTMYYVDTGTQKVAAYDFDAERGEIFNRRIVFDLSGEYNKSGHADSITIDKCGCLYCCMYDGSRVIKIDPYGGRVLQSIEMPTSQITSIAWGEDKLDTLYVTSSAFDVTPGAEPGAGGVHAVYGLGAEGSEANEFCLRSHSN